MWGHPYLTSILKHHANADEQDDGEPGSVVIQCSSIGSLGAASHDWLHGEIGYAMSACHGTSKAQFPAIRVVRRFVYQSSLINNDFFQFY